MRLLLRFAEIVSVTCPNGPLAPRDIIIPAHGDDRNPALSSQIDKPCRLEVFKEPADSRFTPPPFLGKGLGYAWELSVICRR
jgi:hypothetical protein